MSETRDLRRTVSVLRAEVPMRAEWRHRVLRDLDALPPPQVFDAPPAVPRPSWVVTPRVAIAAGLLCAVVGGALTLGIERASHPRGPASLVAERVSAQPSAIRFVFRAPGAGRVTIVGDFNQWSPTATPMRRAPDGSWVVELPLPAGRHAYAFVVDGVVVADPNALDSADDDFGVPSSVILVSEPQRA
jgi:hypothetical protein